MIQHVSLDEALDIHERLIEHFGGPPGVRDLGLLESALFRPGTGYYKDISEMAANVALQADSTRPNQPGQSCWLNAYFRPTPDLRGRSAKGNCAA